MEIKGLLLFLALFCYSTSSPAYESSLEVYNKEDDSNDEFRYPCPVKWKPYRLDDEPNKYGIKSGIYQHDDQAFIARGIIKNTITFGRIKIDGKPGFYTQMGGEQSFNDNPNQIWYLAKNQDCKYSWVDADDESQRKFVIDIGSDEIGIRVFIPRYSQAPPMKGGLFYWDDALASLKIRNITYQTLTCRSKNPITSNKQKYNSPNYPPTIHRSDDSGCKHTWKFFNNSAEPAQDGLNAGLFEANNPAYVGMTMVGRFWRPSRIQTVSPVGAYYLDDLEEEHCRNHSYYLVDNPKYKYYWVDVVGNEYIKNSVAVSQDSGPFRFPIGKAILNGKTIIGLTDGVGGLIYPDKNGDQHVVVQYQVLACDPVPKYKCAQSWKSYKFDTAPATDGFLVGIYRSNIEAFVGRTITPESTQHTIGRIRIGSRSKAGLYYFNAKLGYESLDRSSSVEYLVKNQGDTYQWVSSSSSKAIDNAIRNQENGEFMVGKIQFDDKTYVGAVKAGEGLVFTDYKGRKQVSVNYEVLTCYSEVLSQN
ncbi:hypothetical protein ACKWTF_015046 [Chironomus riparius]